MKEQPRTEVTHIFERIILNTKGKDCKSRKNFCTKNFTYTKKFYVHEIAALNLSKIYFLNNFKKTCKPNNRNLNRDRKTKKVEEICIPPEKRQQINKNGISKNCKFT